MFWILIQIEALSQLKKTFPQGRFWIKADATDLKVCLQESVRGVWNGDSQLDLVCEHWKNLKDITSLALNVSLVN